MKVSTKLRYGLRALVYIGEKNKEEGRLVRIKEIAEDQEISIQYLEQILFLLKKKGIIEGKRGPNGGYKLMKEPKDISCLEIYEILDDELAIVNCLDGGKKCSREDKCRTICLWKKLDGAIAQVLVGTTLQELMESDYIK